MEIYHSKSKKFLQELQHIKKKYNTISLFRLASIVFFLVSMYYYIKTDTLLYLFLGGILLFTFLFLMRLHSKLQFKRNYTDALLSINTKEIAYLEKSELPFENGEEFIDFKHPYAYDLDVFGGHSLFQNLNRTSTYIGKKTLAEQCLNLLSNEEILQNQEAIQELASKLDWRQEFSALGKISKDDSLCYKTLMQWIRFNSEPISKNNVLISIISPVLLLVCLLGYWITSNTFFLNAFSLLFVFNLGFLGKFIKRIQAEIANSSNIDKIISQYSLLLSKIEDENFKSQKLIDLQQQLTLQQQNASHHLKELASLFSNMDSIANLFTAVLFNGTFLFNVHVLRGMIKWKNEHAKALEDWMEVMGEMELLNSLANFSYNNPDFAFPSLNTNYKISFSNLSHPLLNSKNRVGNEVHFQPQSFVILTGSNMSGKSTFLRSIGINMVLTGMGAPVCASTAQVHPMPVLVSMRLSDSLSDSESYFFAEIKRLKQIMDALEQQPAFVLLDEILRGTNSDDKRNGTIEVVKKVIGQKAIGAIATHDIEVCLTTNDYPDTLINKCFEVEIQNDDLYFDYKLRDGICKNKSASFLMKKMGVI